MSTEATKAEHNRTAALRWIDAFNARDDAAESAFRTADYIAHAPDSIETAGLDSEVWVAFLGVFLEGFPRSAPRGTRHIGRREDGRATHPVHGHAHPSVTKLLGKKRSAVLS
jgi:uncharacterized protein (DUF924 family)